MTRRTLIHGGTIVTDRAQFRGDLLLEGEQVLALLADGSGEPADERIDATGLLVMPGAIDAHTHFREPQEDTLEGFTSGSWASAAGGVTTVVEMPQANPTTFTVRDFIAKVARVEEASIVDMALFGGIAPGQHPAEIEGMAAAGAAAFKSFMASSSPSFPAVDTGQLMVAMQLVSPTDLPYALHAEDGPTLAAGLKRMQETGRTDPLAHAESRPPIVEVVAVSSALYLAEITGCWVHICHCASVDALRMIAEARSRGVNVTVETCPQYLTLNTDDLIAQRGFARCAPAIRDQAEVDGIWPYVLDETIDFICSDHCAFTAGDKAAGAEDIFRAPNGISGAQTLFPVFWDRAVNGHGMDPRQVVRQLSTNPAEIFGLYPRKGTLEPGADADVMLFDPEQRWTIRGEDMLHRQHWTPWEGKEIRGRVIRTIRRGETIYDDRATGDARLPARPGSGHFLPRGYGEE